MFWQTTHFRIDLTRPRVMGIVNVTPDSFFDGGAYAGVREAIRHAEELLEQGADILDIGAESTRPGAIPVAEEEELARLVPVMQQLRHLNVPISVDTYKPAVMRTMLDFGVDIINDVYALRQPNALPLMASHPTCGVCLMHMHLTPQTMHLSHMAGDVVAQVMAFMHQRLNALHAAGIARERVVLDPGIGFGKTVDQNLTLLARQADLSAPTPLGTLDLPWLAGWSRKASLGTLTGLAVQERLIPSVTAAVLAVERGARVVRVHDVKETVAALQVWQAMHDRRSVQHNTCGSAPT